jgi:hypothetical protein
MSRTTLVDIIDKQRQEADRGKAHDLRREEKKRKAAAKKENEDFHNRVAAVWSELLAKVECRFSSSLSPCLIFHQDFTKLLDKAHSDEQFELTYHEHNNHDNDGPDYHTRYWELRGRYGFSKEMWLNDWVFNQNPFAALVRALAEFPKVARDYQERFGR